MNTPSGSENSQKSRLDTIQALRGLAALAVVFLHLTGTQLESGIRQSQGLAGYGWMGVDLFFVISGFIMVWVTQTVEPGAKTAGRFLALRAARIYPLWWACVLLHGALYMVIHGVPASLTIIPLADAWTHFIQSFFLIPHQYGPSVGPGWSLLHELYFYVVFAFIILLGLRKYLYLPLLIWSAVTFAGLYFLPSDRGHWLGLFISPYTMHFILGAFTGHLILKLDTPRFGRTALVIGALALALIIGFGMVDAKLRIWQLTIPFCLLVFGCVSAERAGRLRSPKFLTWLGDISYSLYLTHWLVLLAWAILKPIYPGGFLYGFASSLPSLALVTLDFIILITGCLITAQIFYMVVEKPSLKFFRSRLPNYRS